ncbi:MAG: hypothetical protein PHV93_01475 [Candidatus Pacebacteria bacterium]|nr:hypothetical protein [Candidatus Paceibacterota bacterium]
MKNFLKITAPILVVALCIIAYFVYTIYYLPQKRATETVQKAIDFECDFNSVAKNTVQESLGAYHTISFSYPSCFKPSTMPNEPYGYRHTFDRADSTRSYQPPYLTVEIGFVVPDIRTGGNNYAVFPKTVLKKTTYMGIPAEYVTYKNPECLSNSANCSAYSTDIIAFRLEKDFDVERAVNSDPDFVIAIHTSPKDTKDYLPLLESVVSTLVIK